MARVNTVQVRFSVSREFYEKAESLMQLTRFSYMTTVNDIFSVLIALGMERLEDELNTAKVKANVSPEVEELAKKFLGQITEPTDRIPRELTDKLAITRQAPNPEGKK